MPKPHTDKPLADPGTQTEPAARGGGTYGQSDFSRSAQMSRSQTDRRSDLPGESMDRPTEAPGPAEAQARDRLTDSRPPNSPSRGRGPSPD